MKVVKNADGQVVAFGPDGDQYEPFVPEGFTLEYAETAELWIDPAQAKRDAQAKKEAQVTPLALLKLIESGDKARAGVLVAEIETAKLASVSDEQ